MTVPTFPTLNRLRRTLRDNFVEPMRDGRLQTKMDSGPGKVRRRYSSAAASVPMSFDVDMLDKGILENFWYQTTRRGSLPFRIPDQFNHETVVMVERDVELLVSAGVPLLRDSWWLARFGEGPMNIKSLGGEWFLVQFDMLVLP